MAGSPATSVSSTVILTTLQNVVTAVNNWATTQFAISGNKNAVGLTSATVVNTGQGRVSVLSVVTAGSGAGVIYDTTSLTDTSRPICVIPTTAGVTPVNIVYTLGLVVAPGSSQKVSIGYS